MNVCFANLFAVKLAFGFFSVSLTKILGGETARISTTKEVGQRNKYTGKEKMLTLPHSFLFSLVFRQTIYSLLVRSITAETIKLVKSTTAKFF